MLDGDDVLRAKWQFSATPEEFIFLDQRRFIVQYPNVAIAEAFADYHPKALNGTFFVTIYGNPDDNLREVAGLQNFSDSPIWDMECQRMLST
jgi:hypothetical protein